MFDSKDSQKKFLGFLPVGVFPIEANWFKGLNPPKKLWIAFLYNNPIWFLEI
jgi:hypothetical protein